MGYLDKLRELAKDFTEKAQTKDELEMSARMTQVINEAEQDEAKFLKQHEELKASYREAILHGTSQVPPKDDTGTQAPVSFSEFLAKEKK